ncbi:unnamed protein product [Cylicostephanus goldi]|nr:unnamed protein product [Cylicostephanus goldi]
MPEPSKVLLYSHINKVLGLYKFPDISEIHTQNSDLGGPTSEDTRAQAEELPEMPHHERRVSVMFILVIMLGKSPEACMPPLLNVPIRRSRF